MPHFRIVNVENYSSSILIIIQFQVALFLQSMGNRSPDVANSKTLQIFGHRIYMDKTSGVKTAKQDPGLLIPRSLLWRQRVSC